jgi:hypothetical protein
MMPGYPLVSLIDASVRREGIRGTLTLTSHPQHIFQAVQSLPGLFILQILREFTDRLAHDSARSTVVVIEVGDDDGKVSRV